MKITTVLTFRNHIGTINITHLVYSSFIKWKDIIIFKIVVNITVRSLLLYRLYFLVSSTYGNIINWLFDTLLSPTLLSKFYIEDIFRRKGRVHDCVNYLQKISDRARDCIGCDKARRGLASLAPASGRRAFLLPTRAAHARFQFTVRVYGERVEARSQCVRSGFRRFAIDRECDLSATRRSIVRDSAYPRLCEIRRQARILATRGEGEDKRGKG